MRGPALLFRITAVGWTGDNLFLCRSVICQLQPADPAAAAPAIDKWV